MPLGARVLSFFSYFVVGQKLKMFIKLLCRVITLFTQTFYGHQNITHYKIIFSLKKKESIFVRHEPFTGTSELRTLFSTNITWNLKINKWKFVEKILSNWYSAHSYISELRMLFSINITWNLKINKWSSLLKKIGVCWGQFQPMMSIGNVHIIVSSKYHF
jgi:hypothetical protein